MHPRWVIPLGIFILMLGSFWAGVQAEPQQPLYAPGELFIKIRPELDGLKMVGGDGGLITGVGSLDRLNQQYGVTSMARVLFPQLRERGNSRAAQLAGELSRIYSLDLQEGENVQEAAQAYGLDPHVVYAQPNYLNQLCVVPNDSLYHEQWALAKMQMSSAWDIERGSEDVVVGMVDSGIDYEHRDLADNIWINPGEDLDGNGQFDSTDVNGIDDDANGYVDDIRGWDFTDAPQFAGLGDYRERDNDPDDDLGHGTHVSGIVAAMADNHTGVAGLSWHSKLMPLRAAFRMSLGSFLEDDDVSAGIVYAADNGAQVINMSWGDPRVSPMVRDVIAYAYAQGCVLVAAAGNVDQAGIFYPAGYDQTIAAGASTSYDQRATFSSYGRNLDVLAPGSNILSTFPDDQYGTLGGTSMATAHVSGLAALVLSKDPSLSAEEVRQVINASAVDLGPSGWDPEHGNGRIDGLRALSMEQITVAQLSQPQTGTGVDSAVAIVGTALGVYLDCYSLDYGLGLSPTSYQTILEATRSQALEETLTVWYGAAQLPDTSCTIRLRVWETDGGLVEDRVVIHVDHSAPILDKVRTIRRLDDEIFAPFVEWQTDDETVASLFYRHQGQEEFSFVNDIYETREHSLDLSVELGPGDYQYYLVCTNPAGLATKDDNGGQYYDLSNPFEMVDRGGFLLLDQLTPGYLLERPVDLDNDGRGEILFMAFSDTSVYGKAMAYEMGDSDSLEMVFTSEADYLVWDVGDTDGDGKKEILGGGYAVIYLFESPDSASFPDPLNPVWSAEGVWGSQMADTDGDGRGEIVSKLEVGPDVVVFESVGDDTLSPVASLPNPTSGRNSTGTRFAIDDFDGDGKTEILAGDTDGDIYIYEHQVGGDGDYGHTWTDSTGLEDALYVASGDQLDGGGTWFAVAANETDVFDPRSTYWRLMVYQPTGDNEYAPVWSQEIVGVSGQGNGIIAADFTGDGKKEIALCVLPDLYVFERTPEGAFQPIWYTPCGYMYRPLVGDLHGDGLMEIAFNGPDSMVVLERADAGEAPPPPAGLVARPLDAHRVFLEWMAVPGAASYTLHRGLEYGSLVPLQGGILATTFVDSGLVEETTYWYAVTTVDSLGRESLFYSPVVSATPNAPPRIVSAEALTPRHVGVTFNEPMGPSAQMANHYWIDGGVGSPSSVILDRTGHRALLSLHLQLEPEVLYTVEAGEVCDETEVPIAADARTSTFVLPADTLPQPIYIRSVELLDRTGLDVLFSDPVDQSSAEDTSHYKITPTMVVSQARVDSSQRDLVHLKISPIQPRWSICVLQVKDIWDQALEKTIIPGLGDLASFLYPATNLDDAIAYPNPFSPHRDQVLNFARLPHQASASIFTIAGELVWRSEEADLVGTIAWPGVNQDGHPVASGVYVYLLESNGQAKKGKLILIR